MVLDWIGKGNNFGDINRVPWFVQADVPSHLSLSSRSAAAYCITGFPLGVLWIGWPEVGHGAEQLLPGTYEARGEGEIKRVNEKGCYLVLNWQEDNETMVPLVYGEPFTFRFFEYHEKVLLSGVNCRYTALYRTGD